MIGLILDSGVPLCAPPFPVSPEIPIGLEMCSLGPYCLSSFPPFGWRLWWSVPVLPAINTYSSHFSVVGLDSALCSLDAPLFFVNDLLSPLRLAPWSSFLRNNLCALSEHMGRRQCYSTNVPIVLWKWGASWLTIRRTSVPACRFLGPEKQSHGRIEPFLVGYDGLLRPIAREPSFCDLRKG
jgi:hypothetical protein